MRRAWAVAVKELRQIRRDRRTLLILLFIPAFFLFLYGYALNFDIRHIAANGPVVLADVLAHFRIRGADHPVVISVVFEIVNERIVFWQEHYALDAIARAKSAAA